MSEVETDQGTREVAVLLGSVTGFAAASYGINQVNTHEAETPADAIASTEIMGKEIFVTHADIVPGAIAITGIALLVASGISGFKTWRAQQ